MKKILNKIKSIALTVVAAPFAIIVTALWKRPKK